MSTKEVLMSVGPAGSEAPQWCQLNGLFCPQRRKLGHHRDTFLAILIKSGFKLARFGNNAEKHCFTIV